MTPDIHVVSTVNDNAPVGMFDDCPECDSMLFEHPDDTLGRCLELANPTPIWTLRVHHEFCHGLLIILLAQPGGNSFPGLLSIPECPLEIGSSSGFRPRTSLFQAAVGRILEELLFGSGVGDVQEFAKPPAWWM